MRVRASFLKGLLVAIPIALSGCAQLALELALGVPLEIAKQLEKERVRRENERQKQGEPPGGSSTCVTKASPVQAELALCL